MSSITQSHGSSEAESSEREHASSVEGRVAGPHPQVARTARTVRVSTPFALSLVRRLAEIKATAPQKNPITEAEAANILLSVRKTIGRADEDTSGLRSPSTSKETQSSRVLSRSTSHSAASPPRNEEAPMEYTRRRKEAGKPRMSRVIVARRSSSTSAVFVPKAKVATRTKKPTTSYNKFRTSASKLLGTQTIKDCRKGTKFNSNISTLWRETSAEDKAAFGDWSEADQKEYLIKLVSGPQVKKGKTASTIKKHGAKTATRVQPKRGVEGKTKK